MLLGYLLFVAATTTIWSKLSHSNRSSCLKSLKQILFRVPFIDHNRLPSAQLKLIFLFLNLFLFLTRNFLGATIQTDKVKVPTDAIVDSPAKLLSTTKTLVASDDVLKLVKEAPGCCSFFRKLSTRKFLEPDGYLEKMKEQIDNYVAFGGEHGLALLITLLSQHANSVKAVAFVKPTVYFENLYGFKMRKSLKTENKRYINAG